MEEVTPAEGGAGDSNNIDTQIDICHTKVPKSILLQIFQYFDRPTLRAASEVCKSFNELTKHPALWNNAIYSGYVTLLQHNATFQSF